MSILPPFLRRDALFLSGRGCSVTGKSREGKTFIASCLHCGDLQSSRSSCCVLRHAKQPRILRPIKEPCDGCSTGGTARLCRRPPVRLLRAFADFLIAYVCFSWMRAGVTDLNRHRGNPLVALQRQPMPESRPRRSPHRRPCSDA